MAKIIIQTQAIDGYIVQVARRTGWMTINGTNRPTVIQAKRAYGDLKTWREQVRNRSWRVVPFRFIEEE